MKTITSKIVGFSVLKPEDNTIEAKKERGAFVPLEKRPEGCWEGKTCKIKVNSDHGRQSVYFTVNYHEGYPVEIFLPPSQSVSSQQSISVSMKLLSQIARVQGEKGLLMALDNIIDTYGDDGRVTAGFYPDSNKPMQHKTVIAAIGWGIKEMIVNGCVKTQPTMIKTEDVIEAKAENNIEGEASSESESKPIGSKCSKCKDFAVVRLDGCDTCINCGNSKCN